MTHWLNTNFEFRCSTIPKLETKK